jgi:Flp pilus assembly protein TadG
MKKQNKGQALVEFALVLPIFLIVVFGIIDFGRILHSWASLNNQCVNAARAGAKRNSFLFGNSLFLNDSHAGKDSVIKAFWSMQSPFMSNRADFNPDNVDNEPVLSGVGTNSPTVSVSAIYRLNLSTPFLSSIFGSGDGTYTVRASASEDKE